MICKDGFTAQKYTQRRAGFRVRVLCGHAAMDAMQAAQQEGGTRGACGAPEPFSSPNLVQLDTGVMERRSCALALLGLLLVGGAVGGYAQLNDSAFSLQIFHLNDSELVSGSFVGRAAPSRYVVAQLHPAQ